MFRLSKNKQAYLAVLIILLCLTSLVGATYALFTSNLNDGTIGIVTTAGDIEVDIVDAVEDNSLVGEVLQFQTTASNRLPLFEPGAMFYTQAFRVKNTGNIPINFRLAISEDADIGTEEFNEAFEVWISTSPTGISAEAKKITSFTGKLEVGQSSVPYYLFVKMKETAGNEFQGKKYTGIGVTVFAIQGNATIKE